MEQCRLSRATLCDFFNDLLWELKASSGLWTWRVDRENFVGICDIVTWLRILDSIYDTHGLNMEARLSLTIPLLAESELRVFPIQISYKQLCDRLIQRFFPAPNSFPGVGVVEPVGWRFEGLPGRVIGYEGKTP